MRHLSDKQSRDQSTLWTTLQRNSMIHDTLRQSTYNEIILNLNANEEQCLGVQYFVQNTNKEVYKSV